MSEKTYWDICVEESFSAHGIDATAEQIAAVAGDMEVSASMRGEVTGAAYIPHPAVTANALLKQELSIERSKVVCPICFGRGRYRIDGPVHSYSSDCPKCNGEGYIIP